MTMVLVSAFVVLTMVLRGVGFSLVLGLYDFFRDAMNGKRFSEVEGKKNNMIVMIDAHLTCIEYD